jgi:hypothetical protein
VPKKFERLLSAALILITRFSKPEDAEAFAKRFDGKRLPTGSTRSP